MTKQTQTPDHESKRPAHTKAQPEQTPETAVSNPIPALQHDFSDPRTLSAAEAQTLQRTIGNQALGRLIIQRKMTVGPVGDKYEQEADAVAKQVVSKLHNSPTHSAPAQTAQRQEDEDELQMKPLPAISSLQRQEEEELQAEGDTLLVEGELSNDIESSVQNAKSSGQPLDANVRKPMETAFGADFSKVRIHNNAQSHKLNQTIQAKAFTTGQDIFFRQGTYKPENQAGKELLAHELTHTIQQGASPKNRSYNQLLSNGIQRAPWSKKPEEADPFDDTQPHGKKAQYIKTPKPKRQPIALELRQHPLLLTKRKKQKRQNLPNIS